MAPRPSIFRCGCCEGQDYKLTVTDGILGDATTSNPRRRNAAVRMEEERRALHMLQESGRRRKNSPSCGRASRVPVGERETTEAAVYLGDCLFCLIRGLLILPN